MRSSMKVQNFDIYIVFLAGVLFVSSSGLSMLEAKSRSSKTSSSSHTSSRGSRGVRVSVSLHSVSAGSSEQSATRNISPSVSSPSTAPNPLPQSQVAPKPSDTIKKTSSSSDTKKTSDKKTSKKSRAKKDKSQAGSRSKKSGKKKAGKKPGEKTAGQPVSQVANDSTAKPVAKPADQPVEQPEEQQSVE